MFTSQHAKLPNSEKAKLMSDAPKMVKMVDQVAQFLADSLQIRDERLSDDPLVELSRQEILHFPSKDRKKEMEELAKAYQFVAHSEDLADRMYVHARRGAGGNVSVEQFLHEEAYYLDDEVTKEGPTPTSVPVGGIGEKILNDVSSLAMEWLNQLDKVLCEAASIQCSDAATQGLADVKKKLAIAIAERVSVMGSGDVSEDMLSSRSLGEMIEEENKRSVSHGEAMKRTDIRALRMLATLASDPTGNASRKALESELPTLNYVTKTPPNELLCGGKNMNLEQLARALVPDLDIEVRVALATFWADNNGAGVAFAAKDAIRKIEEWSPHSHSFTSVVRESTRAPSSLTIPDMKFLYTEKRVARKGQSLKRSGLDERGERAVRLISCVWELASRSCFSSGVVASDVLAAVATEGVLLGRMAANMINNARNVSNKGFKMSKFLEYLYDMEGDHVAELDKAACALSFFSCSELEFAFDSEGEILPVVCASLTKRTQDKMSYKVESGYKSFATDALAYLLPIIELRRNRLGVPRTCRTSAIADILSTIPAVNAWNPMFGTLRLGLEALCEGHRDIRKLLDQLSEIGVLVRRKGSANKRIQFEFDTPLLNRIMNNRIVA